jgi:hypothetical protein
MGQARANAAVRRGVQSFGLAASTVWGIDLR